MITAHAFARDDDGYYTSGKERLEADSYAITTEDIDLGADPADWAPEHVVGTIRVRVESTTGGPVFLGIARTDDVDHYLGSVDHAELTDFANGAPRYDLHPGRAPRGRPEAEEIWVAESQGTGEQLVDWDAETGIWSAVVMNADASRGISVDTDAGAKIGWLIWVGVGLAVIGLVLTATGVVLVVVIARRAARDPGPTQ